MDVNIYSKFVCKIGRGDKVLFWTDNWLNNGALCETHEEIFKLAKDKMARVVDNYSRVGNTTLWEWDWVREPSTSIEWGQIKALMDVLQGVEIQDQEDVWLWPNRMEQAFSVKGVRKDIEEATTNGNIGRVFLWNNWATKKANIFAWRAVMGRIATFDALQKRGMRLISGLCPNCGMWDESCDHLLVTCMIAKVVWEQICSWLKIPMPANVVNVEGWLYYVEDLDGNEKKKKLINMIFQATLWSIWKARNDKVFQMKNISSFQIVEDIKELSYLWIHNRSRFSLANWNIWCRSFPTA
ncbi:hypothetical protein E3N88_12793 [Mikania micrantha]|uniref:Reverse transcriptase zinc-binding domain-containing protein n=1 Tax=Mikania micrantha TaxID=192012 RepID=A0A5N6P8J7_9ASTR|nr:hypothetical protein E3N88_12793 [Mikania micrantha]